MLFCRVVGLLGIYVCFSAQLMFAGLTEDLLLFCNYREKTLDKSHCDFLAQAIKDEDSSNSKLVATIVFLIRERQDFFEQLYSAGNSNLINALKIFFKSTDPVAISYVIKPYNDSQYAEAQAAGANMLKTLSDTSQDVAVIGDMSEDYGNIKSFNNKLYWYPPKASILKQIDVSFDVNWWLNVIPSFFEAQSEINSISIPKDIKELLDKPFGNISSSDITSLKRVFIFINKNRLFSSKRQIAFDGSKKPDVLKTLLDAVNFLLWSIKNLEGSNDPNYIYLRQSLSKSVFGNYLAGTTKSFLESGAVGKSKSFADIKADLKNPKQNAANLATDLNASFFELKRFIELSLDNGNISNIDDVIKNPQNFAQFITSWIDVADKLSGNDTKEQFNNFLNLAAWFTSDAKLKDKLYSKLLGLESKLKKFSEIKSIFPERNIICLDDYLRMMKVSSDDRYSKSLFSFVMQLLTQMIDISNFDWRRSFNDKLGLEAKGISLAIGRASEKVAWSTVSTDWKDQILYQLLFDFYQKAKSKSLLSLDDFKKARGDDKFSTFQAFESACLEKISSKAVAQKKGKTQTKTVAAELEKKLIGDLKHEYKLARGQLLAQRRISSFAKIAMQLPTQTSHSLFGKTIFWLQA